MFKCDLGYGQGRKSYDLIVVFVCQVDKGSVGGYRRGGESDNPKLQPTCPELCRVLFRPLQPRRLCLDLTQAGCENPTAWLTPWALALARMAEKLAF